ncbi:DUF3050 domain-containing protein [Tumebacillus permanentifrigoris]|uniref:DUF3050 family protein n=1 Tax=Tumebacillus permanentifrigoris TaxID=378543 RepID=A0A316D2K2_9BACL|nr:DUF3050 domain-containing protein [Tumebacillus permanentifrigoris]PWK04990.1 hypothetical protein C7459_1304 [Tumebacillus permanentifrigoris]
MKTLDIQNMQSIRDRLLEHDIYKELNTADKVRTFMKHHVFAVWDFMSLLKRLQQLLTDVNVPWMPGRETQYARFINEIVLGEETDEDGAGGYISHFDLYLQAMEQVGADTAPILNFLQEVREGKSIEDALTVVGVPESVRQFVSQTMHLALHGESHEVAAAFFYGREDIIPDMFTHLVRDIEGQGREVDRLVYYLHRHIELDGDSHGPLAGKLLQSLCGDDPEKLQAAVQTAEASLEARIRLWQGVVDDVRGVTSW